MNYNISSKTEDKTLAMRIISTLFSLFLIFLSSHAFSSSKNKTLTGTGEISHSYGGVALASIPLESGLTDNIRVSEGSAISMGFRHWLYKRWSVKYIAGYRYKSAGSNSTDVRLTAYPLTLMPSVHWKHHSFGIGATYFFDTKLDFSDARDDVYFEDSLGITFEYRYHWLGVSYTFIDYQLPNRAETVNGNHFSIKFMEEF